MRRPKIIFKGKLVVEDDTDIYTEGRNKVQGGGVNKIQGFENFSDKGRLYCTTEFFSAIFWMFIRRP